MDDPKLTSSAPELDQVATLQKIERFDEEVMYESGMWIFGYGALCWLHDFKYDKSLIGHIRGFSRKFWQGNTAHRGTPEKPGRVATLVQEEGGMVWGVALQIKDKQVFSFLHNRECTLGGYFTTISTFYPRQGPKGEKCKNSFPVILYIATPLNNLWLGDVPLPEIANQIVECKGNSGYNVEYLLKLANFVRENIPEADDEHLFTLEKYVRAEIANRNLCLATLMGGKVERQVTGEGAGVEGGRERTEAVKFKSTVPSKKLCCVDI